MLFPSQVFPISLAAKSPLSFLMHLSQTISLFVAVICFAILDSCAISSSLLKTSPNLSSLATLFASWTALLAVLLASGYSSSTLLPSLPKPSFFFYCYVNIVVSPSYPVWVALLSNHRLCWKMPDIFNASLLTWYLIFKLNSSSVI